MGWGSWHSLTITLVCAGLITGCAKPSSSVTPETTVAPQATGTCDAAVVAAYDELLKIIEAFKKEKSESSKSELKLSCNQLKEKITDKSCTAVREKSNEKVMISMSVDTVQPFCEEVASGATPPEAKTAPPGADIDLPNGAEGDARKLVELESGATLQIKQARDLTQLLATSSLNYIQRGTVIIGHVEFKDGVNFCLLRSTGRTSLLRKSEKLVFPKFTMTESRILAAVGDGLSLYCGKPWSKEPWTVQELINVFGDTATVTVR